MKIYFVCGLLLGALWCGGARAQNAPVGAPVGAGATEVQTVYIPLRNVPPSLMAYWLDPARQPMPVTLRSSLANEGGVPTAIDELPRQPGNGKGPRDLRLPDGVSELISVDPQNVLRARGTAAGLEALVKLVSQIDVPLGRVEIEAQIVEVAPADLDGLQLPFRWTELTSEEKGEGIRAVLPDLSRPALAQVAPQLPGQLNALIAADRAKILFAPRVTAIDGLTARLYSTRAGPVLMPDAPASATETLDFATGLAFVESRIGMRATPVLHGAVAALDFEVEIEGQVARARANLRDGQTLALLLPRPKSAAYARVVFVTARIVRRTGEDVPMPRPVPVAGLRLEKSPFHALGGAQ